MRVLIVDYSQQESGIRAIRERVFVEEQHVDREEEFDGRDSACSHAIVFQDELPIGTGRLDIEKGGKIGRVAVLADYRRRGVGSRIMQALESVALEHSLPKIWFHAQVSAIPFYESLGYRTTSEEFLEANIPHVVMEKTLAAQ